MRTSGRGRSDAVLFVAPALIFLGVLIHMQGGLPAAVQSVDRWLLKSASAVASLISDALR
jgi:hypothetical protein